MTNLGEATDCITQIIEKCGLETHLSGIGVRDDAMETLLDHIRWDRIAVLPRTLDREDARALLQGLM